MKALRCPGCAVSLNVVENEEKAYSESERDTAAIGMPADILDLAPEVRKVLGPRVGPRRVLCLGCSKDISRVFLMTDGDDLTMLSLDRNLTQERLGLFAKVHPHTVIATMKQTKFAETVALMSTHERSRRLYIRLFDMGYDSFFAKSDLSWRADVLIDKMSWLAQLPTALGHHLHSLKKGGFWITDLNLAPGADWMLELLGLQNVTERLPIQMRYKNWGYSTIQLYQKTREMPLELSLYAMFFWAESFKPASQERISLETLSSPPEVTLEKYLLDQLRFLELLKASKDWPQAAALDGLEWWEETLKIFKAVNSKVAPSNGDVKEPPPGIALGDETTVQVAMLRSEFPAIGEALDALTREQQEKEEDDRLSPIKIQVAVLKKLADVGMTLVGKKGTFKVILIPNNPALMGPFRLKRFA
ncbi:MAG: hypothetical protein EOO71_14990 [Myxococcaceae bacterium]|nr:MAG: hypothetical protein EOO71_14990 [Myxococcaceae bacterium]